MCPSGPEKFCLSKWSHVAASSSFNQSVVNGKHCQRDCQDGWDGFPFLVPWWWKCRLTLNPLGQWSRLGFSAWPGPAGSWEICDRTMAGRRAFFQEYLGGCSRYLLPEEGSLKAAPRRCLGVGFTGTYLFSCSFLTVVWTWFAWGH